MTDDNQNKVTQLFDGAGNPEENTGNASDPVVVVLKDVATYPSAKFTETIQRLAGDIAGCVKMTEGSSDAYFEFDPAAFAQKMKVALEGEGFTSRNSIVSVKTREQADQLQNPAVSSENVLEPTA